MKNPDFTCAILAGGKASRYNGHNKALIKVGDNTNLDKLIALSEELFAETILITNSPDQYSDYTDLRIEKDIYQNVGPLAGIHSAIYHAKKPYIFIFACDMPFINKKLVIDQIATFRNSNCDILVPRINDFFEPLHSIYAKSVLGNLENHIKTTKSLAIRAFFDQVKAGYWDLEDNAENHKAFSNINTQHDHQKAIELNSESLVTPSRKEII